MKKLLVLSVIMLLAISCGCNSVPKNESGEPSSKTDATVTVLTESEAKQTAKTLFENLDKIDKLGASAIDMDESDTFKDGEIYTYAKVTDKQFTSLDKVKKFVNDNLTEKAKKSKYSTLYEGEHPQYKEKDGVLYVINGGRGCGYPIKNEITVSDITETSFSAKSDYDNFGGDSVLEIKVVSEDGVWKIDEFKTVD